MKTTLRIGLIALLVGCTSCNRQNAQQQVLFTQAASNEATAPGPAASLYRKAAAIDPTTELGRAALDRAELMDKKGREMRQREEERIARVLQSN